MSERSFRQRQTKVRPTSLARARCSAQHARGTRSLMRAGALRKEKNTAVGVDDDAFFDS